MTCISHSHKFAYIHIYKAGGTAITNFLLPYARKREQIAHHSVGRKLFYAVNIAQEKAAFGRVPKGTSSWYMGLQKHAPITEVVTYLGPHRQDYRLFSVIREPISWVESQYNYISSRPLHAQHTLVSNMSIVEYVEDFIGRRRALQIDMLRPGKTLAGARREIDAVFSLESLSGDIGPLCDWLGIKIGKVARDLPRRNQSSGRATMRELPRSLQDELATYLAPDVALYEATTLSGGALIATPFRPVPLPGVSTQQKKLQAFHPE